MYFDYFRSHNISTIIRLNKRMYDAKRSGIHFFKDVCTLSVIFTIRFLLIVLENTICLAVFFPDFQMPVLNMSTFFSLTVQYRRMKSWNDLSVLLIVLKEVLLSTARYFQN